MNFSILKL